MSTSWIIESVIVMKLVKESGDRRVAMDVVQHQGLADRPAVERRLDLAVARVVAAHEADDDEPLAVSDLGLEDRHALRRSSAPAASRT